MTRRFEATEILPALKDHVCETMIFAQNGVSVSVRVNATNARVSYMITSKEGRERAYEFKDNLISALYRAEELQGR
jgi:hypothetical protein